MRFSRVSSDLLSSPERMAVLSVLLGGAKKIFSGREVARLAGVSPPGAWRILKNLEEHGMVSRIRVGNADSWQVRENHFLTEKLGQVERMEREAFALLRQVLLESLNGLDAYKVILFGSIARGDEKPKSDIDLLVVVKNAEQKELARDRLLDASVKISEKFGNSLSPAVYSLKEFKAKTNSQLFKNIKMEGRVILPNIADETSTARVEKHKSDNYWSKATEFFTFMKKAEEEEQWSAASLNAIHCAISTVDAVTVATLCERSKSQKHDDASLLLVKTSLPACAEKAKQFRDIISLKNFVEYDSEEITESEALRICMQAERIYKWAKQHLKK